MTDGENRSRRQPAAREILEKGRLVAGKLPLVGHVAWLCSQSNSHRYLFIQDLEWRILPPILLDQFRLFMDRRGTDLPTAFVSWARLSEDGEGRYVDSQRLAPHDWDSGDRLWLIDVIVPFGSPKAILKELQHVVHSDCAIHLLYPDRRGTPQRTTVDALLRGSQRQAGVRHGQSDSGTYNRH